MFLTGDVPVKVHKFNGRPVSWTLLHDTILVGMLRAGRTEKEFVKLFGVSEQDVEKRASVLYRAKRRGRSEWTDQENKYLKAHYQSMSLRLISAKLDRSERVVLLQAKSLGLTNKKCVVVDDDIIGKVIALHREGLCDSTIAEVIKCNRRTIGGIRKRLGLSPNRVDDSVRVKLRANAMKVASKHGFSSIGEYQASLRSKRAADLGWPGVCESAAKCADYMHRNGPATREMLADYLGLTNGKNRLSTSRKGGTITAELIRAGYAIELKTALKNQAGEWVSLYMIPLGVEPLKPETN